MVRKLNYLWQLSYVFETFFFKGHVVDRPRSNDQKFLISREGFLEINKELLHHPFITANLIRSTLNLVASTRKVRIYIKLLGWRRAFFVRKHALPESNINN